MKMEKVYIDIYRNLLESAVVVATDAQETRQVHEEVEAMLLYPWRIKTEARGRICLV